MDIFLWVLIGSGLLLVIWVIRRILSGSEYTPNESRAGWIKEKADFYTTPGTFGYDRHHYEDSRKNKGDKGAENDRDAEIDDWVKKKKIR